MLGEEEPHFCFADPPTRNTDPFRSCCSSVTGETDPLLNCLSMYSGDDDKIRLT
ncbi:unnamed protein product, partial [Rotaria magnacalcarata]